MTSKIKGDCFDEIYEKIVASIVRNPDYVCSPRGSKIKENLAFTFTLTNPRARLLTNSARATNYGFGVGEFLWYWKAQQDLESMVYYNKRMKDFSDDGVTLNSAYGYRMKRMDVGSGLTQWHVAIKTLTEDSDSRRAILHINQPHDQWKAAAEGSKDVPCTLSLQFFVRDGKLDLHAHMRSNDVIWGLTYDLFSFTLFQECMLLELRKHEKFRDLELGKYHHTAGSLHIYERHFDQAEQILAEYRGYKTYHGGTMRRIPSLEELADLGKFEEMLRTRKMDRIDPGIFSGATQWMAEQLNAHREKRDGE
jgi:thymidylate synthase